MITGEVLQWQWSLPPEKEGEPLVMPLLMRGCKLNDMVGYAMIGVSSWDLLFWQRDWRGVWKRKERIGNLMVLLDLVTTSRDYGCDYLAEYRCTYPILARHV